MDHVDYPHLKMQIPGGTIEQGESPKHAAIREAQEETGLSGLVFKAFLGNFEKDLSPIGKDETIHAWFFHLSATDVPAPGWRHTEAHPHGQAGSIRFQLYWVELEPRPVLGGIDDAMYAELLESLHNV